MKKITIIISVVSLISLSCIRIVNLNKKEIKDLEKKFVSESDTSKQRGNLIELTNEIIKFKLISDSIPLYYLIDKNDLKNLISKSTKKYSIINRFSWCSESYRLEIPIILKELEPKYTNVDLFMISMSNSDYSEEDLIEFGLYSKNSLKLNFPIFSLDYKRDKSSFFGGRVDPFWKIIKEIYPDFGDNMENSYGNLIVINNMDNKIIYISRGEKGELDLETAFENDINFIKSTL